ncbi:MAG: hypothetical protein II721_04205 [Bacilli bacterium]|nr:hypothetical protein [Bacilli bacterium]
MKKTSLYIDAPIPKRGRKLQSLILDFAILIILNVILLFGIDSIVSAAGGQKGISEAISSNESSLKAIIADSHLDEFDSANNPLGPKENAKNYLLRLTYGSLLHGGKTSEEISKTLYNGIKSINEENELCYYYYTTFKIDKNNAFLQEYSANCGDIYYRSILTQGMENRFVESGFPYLTLESAEAIDESYRNINYTEGMNLRNAIQTRYQSLLENAIKELEAGYSPYIEARKAYEQNYKDLWFIKIYESFGAYGLSMIVMFFALPLVFKDGLTPSCKILRLPYKRVDGHEPRVWNNALRCIVLTVEYLLSPIVALLLVYGANASYLLSLSLFGSIPVFTLMIYSFLLMLVSYLISFITRERKQTLSELASSLVLVEGREIVRDK